MKLVEGVERVVRANKGVGKDITDLSDKSKEALKAKAKEASYFYGEAQKIMKYDGKALES